MAKTRRGRTQSFKIRFSVNPRKHPDENSHVMVLALPGIGTGTGTASHGRGGTVSIGGKTPG